MLDTDKRVKQRANKVRACTSYHSTLTHSQITSLSCTRGCSREMSGRRVSRLPSLKAPSPASNTQNSANVSPAPSSAGQTRSRRTSVSSNENGSLSRDAHLSDFAFVEQLEDFRRQLLDLRKEKKKYEEDIIKYKLLCKDKHQTIQDLNNKLEQEKANLYDMREQMTRDLTLQLNNQHASEKKKLHFDMSILKNEKRKMESEIRLLETTNKGLFEEIRQIRSSYDAKMEKLMKDFHIEIYKESGEKRRLERKLQDTNEKLTKEEFLAKQLELEKDRADAEASDARKRRMSTFGSDFGTLDRQNKRIAELEETVRKLESLKTIAESQNLDLMKKLKESEKSKTLPRSKPPVEKKESPGSERKRKINTVTGKDKVEAADKKIATKDGNASTKDLEGYLKLANKERNVLERKLALLEKTRAQTGDEKIDNELAALRQQHRALLDNIAAKDKLLEELQNPDEFKSKIQPPSSGLKIPGKGGKGPKSPKTGRRISRSPSPLMKLAETLTEEGEEEAPKKKKEDLPKKELPKKVETIDREQQTLAPRNHDKEIQVEFYDEEEDDMFDSVQGMNMGGGGAFMFQEPEPMQQQHQDPILGGAHSNDTAIQELEEKIVDLQEMREKDMTKLSVLSEKLEQYKQDVTSLTRKAGAYYSELEIKSTKLDDSRVEVEKLNDEVTNLKVLNSSLLEQDQGAIYGDDKSQAWAEAKKEVEQLTSDLREKQLTIMKLHQELHEASESMMDKSSMVRQLEVVVDNLKNDKEIMREEQMNFETTTEEVLDQLRTHKVRSNQLEELMKSQENDVENYKRDIAKLMEESEKLQGDKERLEVEVEEMSSRMAARDTELATALSEQPNSENGQATLHLLQEVRAKDNSLKKLQKKHDDTIHTLKREVEKQVNSLQNKVSRREGDMATIKSQHNQETSELISQINELHSELSNVRDTVSEKERELEEVYSSIAQDKSNSSSSIESKELNKRLAELANENMMLKDQLADYRRLMQEKRPAGFMGELGDRIQTQRPSFSHDDKKREKRKAVAPSFNANVTDSDKSTNYDVSLEEEDEEEDIGEISVALVLYSYDPATMSPNDYPEDELALNSGDFIYIFGDPDVDGFYTAELMSGERGLVPSNFIQTVELNEKKTQQMRRMSQTQRMSLAPIVQSSSDNTQNKDIPVPEEIEYESIGTKTLELKWELPDTGCIVPILGFKIYVNSKEFKVTNTGECRTVLNELPPGRPLYISLKTISLSGESSESKPCVYGRETIKAPQSLDVTNVSTDSAVVTFVGLPHYNHGVFLNGEFRCVLKPGEFVYMLKDLEPDNEYEIRIVTLPSEDSSVVNQKSFALSQSTTFLTEIGCKEPADWKPPSPPPPYCDDWKPPSPPPSIEPVPPAPDDLQLNILDRHTIQLSWCPVEGATSYCVYLNCNLERTSHTELSQTFALSELRADDDEQSFYVIAVNQHDEKSCPSDSISFFKSELFGQLSSYFPEEISAPGEEESAPPREAEGTPPPSDTSSEAHLEEDLPEEIKSKLLVRLTKPLSLDVELSEDQLICVEREGDGYRTTFGERTCFVPRAAVVPVPIVKRVVALYEYLPTAMSPNTDSFRELDFKAGDVILVYDQDKEGFYKGVLDNRSGLVPSNFVLDLEAVLNYTTSLEESDKEDLASLGNGLLPNLMTVNSS